MSDNYIWVLVKEKTASAGKMDISKFRWKKKKNTGVSRETQKMNDYILGMIRTGLSLET